MYVDLLMVKCLPQESTDIFHSSISVGVLTVPHYAVYILTP